MATTSIPTTKIQKETFEDLFAQRDATQPGSKEEEQVANKIVEAMFPDSSHGSD